MESQQKVIKKRGFSLDITLDPYNRRVRVDDYLGDFEKCMAEAQKAAVGITAEKLIFKARKENFSELITRGYLCEGMLDQYFSGSDCFFFAKYFKNERRNSDKWVEEDQILDSVLSLQHNNKSPQPPAGYLARRAKEEDSGQLAALYRNVFEVYPVPIQDPDYIKKCMRSGTVFFIYEFQGDIISSASAEVNGKYHNAEITDCATLPEHRQFGLMKHLIRKLEDYLAGNEVFCVYSIARALSFGMNAAFYQLGYGYRGRLANNCFIFDKMEDMNLWVKNIS
ncbi:putative beta-lysine N-acetyltransferase [Peribacillus glennii]|uniref:Putative beta-lysine N-acetyltransferase n=1 Tax=Peribacillus glennii TaxID=2303991 RepID=A0A372LGL7_9BACI|nr:putative beta-lysine N-acetyltransferase [Peribacillus glennii]RFU65437.1 putative beta-lysine N-acetyltransferase [Peribacillus glennii]